MRREKIEDEERAFRMETERLKTEAQNEVKRLKAAAQKSAQSVQKGGHLGEMTRSNELMTRVNEPRQTKKMDRQNAIVELVNTNPKIGPTELTKQLNELGHSTSVSTVKRDVRALNGKLKS
jgi:archaellum component FlaC